MKNLKRISLMLCFAIASFIFTACGETKQKLVLSADKQIAYRGEVVTCVAVLEEDGKNKSSDSITYEIVSGQSSATIVDNKLTVSLDAQPGDVIKVVAKLNNLVSNEVEIVISVPLSDITISANGITNITAGDSVRLTKTLNPTVSDVSDEDVRWVVVQGEDICTITEDEIRVNSNVSTGEIIKVKAVCGTLESNVLTFVVGYPLESINISILGSTNIPNGQTRPISITLSPSNATNANNISWEFIEGEDLCVIMNGFIYINEDAPVGSIIRFKAVSGNIKSDVVSIVVGTPIQTITLSATGLEDGAVTSRTVNIKVGVEPSGASTAGIVWAATTKTDDVEEYVESIEDGVLVLKSSIPVGTIINITATSAFNIAFVPLTTSKLVALIVIEFT